MTENVIERTIVDVMIGKIFCLYNCSPRFSGQVWFGSGWGSFRARFLGSGFEGRIFWVGVR